VHSDFILRNHYNWYIDNCELDSLIIYIKTSTASMLWVALNMGMSAARWQGNVREFQSVWRVVILYNIQILVFSLLLIMFGRRSWLHYLCYGLRLLSNMTMMWHGQLSNHTYRLLFKHGVSASSATLRKMPDESDAKQILSAPPPPRRTGGDHQDMDEDYSAGPDINEPVRERSNRHGSESSTLEIDVYVWC